MLAPSPRRQVRISCSRHHDCRQRRTPAHQNKTRRSSISTPRFPHRGVTAQHGAGCVRRWVVRSWPCAALPGRPPLKPLDVVVDIGGDITRLIACRLWLCFYQFWSIWTLLRRNDLRPHFYPYGYGRTAYGYAPTPLTLRPSLRRARRKFAYRRTPRQHGRISKTQPILSNCDWGSRA